MWTTNGWEWQMWNWKWHKQSEKGRLAVENQHQRIGKWVHEVCARNQWWDNNRWKIWNNAWHGNTNVMTEHMSAEMKNGWVINCDEGKCARVMVNHRNGENTESQEWGEEPPLQWTTDCNDKAKYWNGRQPTNVQALSECKQCNTAQREMMKRNWWAQWSVHDNETTEEPPWNWTTVSSTKTMKACEKNRKQRLQWMQVKVRVAK